MGQSPIGVLKQRYYVQRATAERRDIPFLLTFDQWLLIWLWSGHLDERGKRKGQYVMSRPFDRGSYVVGNVIIQLATANNSQGRKGTRHTAAAKRKMSTARRDAKGIPRPHSTAAKRRMSEAHKGVPHSTDRKRKIGAAMKRSWRTRRNALKQ